MTTSSIASWVTGLDHDHIPDAVRNAAHRSLYNYIGCTLHGFRHPTVHRATAAIRPFFAQPTSILFGTAERTDAQHAALLCGIASHVHDYDDTHLATIIHPTGPVASTLLAYVQHIYNTSNTSTKGQDLLDALKVGIEVECKLGLAVYPRHYDIGWHITSTTGSIGAAVAVAKLMNLPKDQVVNAIGIAASQVTGLRCNFGSDTKSFHVGRAAQNGLLAALLAQQGFTSDEGVIEAKRGWANVVTGGQDHNRDIQIEKQMDRYINELGKVWEIEANSFKPFPCGIVAHPAIDAAIRLQHRIIDEVGEQDLLQRLERLKFRARVHRLVAELTGKENPRDGLEAKFSVFHGVAVGLLYGKAGPAQYEDDIVKEEQVGSIRRRIEAIVDEEIRSDETMLDAFEDEKDIPAFSVHVQHAIGSFDVPMTDEQLTQKFVDQVSLDVGVDEAKRMSDVCWKIGQADDVNDTLKQLKKRNQV